MFNLFIALRNLETPYALNEQKWVTESLILIMLSIAGFTIYRAITIDVVPTSREFVCKSTILIAF